MDIYVSCLGRITQGASYTIDFPTRTLVLDGKKIIDKGKYDGKLHFQPQSTDNVMEIIEDLYQMYKHSIPSEKTDSRRKTYFKALKEQDLSSDDMMYGERRMEVMFNLEFFILDNILNGSLVWQNDWGWFWQSEKDKDLVILKQWVVGE